MFRMAAKGTYDIFLMDVRLEHRDPLVMIREINTLQDSTGIALIVHDDDNDGNPMTNRCLHVHGAEGEGGVAANGNDQTVGLAQLCADTERNAYAHATVISGCEARSG